MDSHLEQRLRTLLNAFLEENTKLNLSAIRDPERAWVGHVLDSMALIDYMADTNAKVRTQNVNKLLDVGTGGGFPLLPLAIALPQAECIGLDSTGKKLAAIGNIAHAAGITNVKTLLGRAEDIAHDPKHREQYDVVTARAVADTRVLLEYNAPFTKIGGHVVLWKSVNVEGELDAAKEAERILGLKFVDRYTYELPGDFGQRQLIIYEKVKATPKEYPRKNGEPKKHPL